MLVIMQTVASFLILYLHMKLPHIDLLQRFAAQMPNGQNTLKTHSVSLCLGIIEQCIALSQSQALFRENAVQDFGSALSCSGK